MYKQLYKNNYKISKEEIISVLNRCGACYSEEENRFIISSPPNTIDVTKIAFNDEGILENYIDYRKYHFSVLDKDTDGKTYIRKDWNQYHKSFLIYDNIKNTFKSLVTDYYNKDDFYILKEEFTHLIDKGDSLNKDLIEIRSNANLFYKLKKSLMDIEEISAIDNISIDDIGESSQHYFIINSEKFHPKKSKQYFICKKCKNGFLNFDVEYFLKNGTQKNFKSRYKCSNSLCNEEIISFEKLREKFWEDLYTDKEIEEEYRQIDQNINTHSFNDNYDEDYFRTSKREIEEVDDSFFVSLDEDYSY